MMRAGRISCGFGFAATRRSRTPELRCRSRRTQRTQRTRRNGGRGGFTLVELLVAMALAIFVMTILVEAFVTAMDTFTGLRSIGDMQDNLRTALQIMRDDLSQAHFDGAKKTSDANFWDEPPREGFVYLKQYSALQAQAATAVKVDYRKEGADPIGNPICIARDHVMHFTARRRGNRRQNFFMDPTDAGLLANHRIAPQGLNNETFYGTDGSLNSQWAEIAYFLIPTGWTVTNNDVVSGQPTVMLHNLYRVQYVVAPFVDDMNGTITWNPTQFQNVSRKLTPDTNGKFQFYSPNDLANGSRRFQLPAAPLNDYTKSIPPNQPIPLALPTNGLQQLYDPKTNAQQNAAVTLLCSNVTSFQIQVRRNTTPAGVAFEDLKPTDSNGNPVGNAPVAFDSNTKPSQAAGVPANRVPDWHLLGVQIILRVYDPASGLSRQASLIQDL
jgi:type II secretory pathway pseudopilin PulG